MRAICVAFALAVLLVGCASREGREALEWSKRTEAMAVVGEIKWSDYYKQFFDKIVALPVHPDKAEYLDLTNLMIQIAERYESGEITKDQFDTGQRNYKAGSESIEGRRSAASRAHWAGALQKIGNDMSQNSQNYYQQQQQRSPAYKPPVVCDSRYISGGVQTVCK